MKLRLKTFAYAALSAFAIGAGPALGQGATNSANHQALIEASKSENGLLIYSNLPTSTWAEFRKLLSQTYPWVKMDTTDMGSEMWERYFAESGAGTRTADLMSTVAPDRFADFIDRGQVDPYVSREIDALPKWSRPEPGLYTISASPAILAFNRAQVKNPPKSIRDVGELIKADPKGMNGKVTTYDLTTNSFGTSMFASWLRGEGNSWDILTPIGAAARPEQGAGVMREKVMTGEYNVALFFSSVSLVPLERPEVKRLVGWDYIADGTPVTMQSIVVTKAAKSPNTAKIVLDLMLSREGQIALAKVGLTPYRDDVPQDGLPYPTLKTAAAKIGEKNLIHTSFDRAKFAEWPAIVAKFKATFKK